MLVEYDWPVIREVTTENGSSTRGMIYYIGFWLPSAVFGKIFTLNAGYYFQFFWAILGVSLVYYFVCNYFKKLSVFPLLGMIFFSGLDILGYYMIDYNFAELKLYSHIEFWCSGYQFSSMTTQLFWVFNQAIYNYK